MFANTRQSYTAGAGDADGKTKIRSAYSAPQQQEQFL